MENLNLTQLKSNEKAKVTAINGGFGFIRRVETLGIREGAEIKKISSQLMRGPITIQIGNSQVALGFGMAQKIIVRKD